MGLMYQCELYRNGMKTIGWIPERGAKIGAKIELKADDNNLWTVLQVFNHAMTEEQLRAKQQNDRDALPSLRK
jgi:hypothetical protein